MSVKVPAGYFSSFIGHGKVTHAIEKGATLTLCKKSATGATDASDQREDAPVSCKACGKAIDLLAVEANANGESDTMAKNDVTTDEGAKVLEQIDANIDRAASLAEAGNDDALEELESETETLISSLSGKGVINIKKSKRDSFRAAQERPTVGVPTTRETQDYKTVEGVSELVDLGAEKFAEGVSLHVKTRDIAADIARVILDQRVRISNKAGLPDLKAASNAAKTASSDMYSKAGELYRAHGAASDKEVKKAMDSLVRSVQNQMANTVATYLVELEHNPGELERFAEVITSADDQSPAEAIAEHYGLSAALTKVKELEAGESGEGGDEGEGDAEELTDPQRISQFFVKAESQLDKAVKVAKKALDAEEKRTVKTHIDSLIADLAKLSASL